MATSLSLESCQPSNVSLVGERSNRVAIRLQNNAKQRQSPEMETYRQPGPNASTRESKARAGKNYPVCRLEIDNYARQPPPKNLVNSQKQRLFSET